MSASRRVSVSAIAVAIVTGCPACREGVGSQQSATYAFARAYLCDHHREVWADADQRAHAKGCPHRPRTCVLDRAGCVEGGV